MQQIGLCAALLIEADFDEPRLIIEPTLDDRRAIDFIRFPWKSLLKKNRKAQVFNVELERQGYILEDTDVPTLAERWRVGGLQHFIWRLSERVWSRVPDHWGKKRLYWVKENEIVRDVGAGFALRGYRILRLNIGGPQAASKAIHAKAQQIIDLLRPQLEVRLSAVIAAHAFDPLIDIVRERLSGELQAYDQTLDKLQSDRKFSSNNERSIILTNYPNGGAMLALAQCALQNKIVFASAQHGITHEIVDKPQNHCNFENVFAPYTLLLTGEAKERMDAGPFGLPNSKTHVIGQTSEFKRLSHSLPASRKKRRSPVLYVQTLDRVGPFFNGGTYQNDFTSSQHEQRLIAEVLSLVPHQVAFKPYPSRRYFDRDPALDLARNATNIRVLESGKDLRYIVSDHRVVISVGATSTLNWCFASGIPLIYIDPASYGHRISSDLLSKFQKICFYFDATDASFFSNLKIFLSLPLTEIENAWRQKKADHADMVLELIGDTHGSSGRKGYQWLKQQMLHPSRGNSQATHADRKLNAHIANIGSAPTEPGAQE